MKRASIAIAITIGVVAVYASRLDDIAGLYKDDAYYMVLAESLVGGHGYALINSATAPLLPAFPPGFALVLAPVFALIPSYPDNLVWVKAVSIVAMLGTGLLTFRYWRTYRDCGIGRAAVIAVLTTLTPGFVFLATSTVMSECVFTFAVMGTAIAVERAARKAQSSRAIVFAAAMATAVWLIRGAGIAFVGGAAVFLLWKRGWRAAAGFAAVCAISYAPWAAYDAMHRATPTERAAYGGDVVRYYGSPLRSREGGTVPPGELRGRVTANLVNIFGRDIGAAIFPAAYRGADESGLEVFHMAGSTGLRAGSMGVGPPLVATTAVLSLIVILGGVTMARRRLGAAEFFSLLTIGMLALVNAHTFRLVLPIAPFLIAYFLIGVESIAASLRADCGPPAFRIAGTCLLCFLIYDHGRYVWLKTQGPSPGWIQDGHEIRVITDFVNAHLPADATIVSTNPGLVYLLTGRRSISYVDPDVNWSPWQAAGIRYAVALHVTPEPDASLGYRPLFESPRLKLWVLELVAATGR